jgi:hypothetical protein
MSEEEKIAVVSLELIKYFVLYLGEMIPMQ